MKQVIYTSATTRNFNGTAFANTLERLRVRNHTYGLSGILYIHAGSLLHVLEGPEPYLSATFGRILRDPRHTSINILSVKEVPLREFGNQSMALFDTSEDAIPAGPMADVRLRPLLTLNEATARRFLQALNRAQPTAPTSLGFIPYINPEASVTAATLALPGLHSD
jgi:hypothetical protein